MSRAILSALQEMAVAFPRQNVTPETVKVYYKHLSDMPEVAVIAAINQAIETSTFFPSIGELRGIISEHANGPDDLAETAWNEVQAEVRRVGYQPNRTFRNGVWYEPAKPEFSSERIAEAVQSIGWKTICTGDIEDVRRDFIFTYRNLRKRDVNKVQRGDFGTNGPALGEGDISAAPALDGRGVKALKERTA